MTRALLLVGMWFAVAGCKKNEPSGELLFSGPDLDQRSVEAMQKRLEAVGLDGTASLTGGKLKVTLNGLQKKVASERFAEAWRIGGRLELFGLEDATAKSLCTPEPDAQVKTERLSDQSVTCYLEGTDREALLKKAPEPLRANLRFGRGEGAGSWRSFLTDGKPFLTGKHVVEADVVSGQDGRPAIQVRFDEEGKALFARHTELLLDLRLAVVLDDVVLMAPRVMERIPGGSATITLPPGATKEEAQLMALAIGSGELSGLKLESETVPAK